MSPIILGRAKSLLFAKWFTDSFCLYKSDEYEPKSFDFNSFLTLCQEIKRVQKKGTNFL